MIRVCDYLLYQFHDFGSKTIGNISYCNSSHEVGDTEMQESQLTQDLIRG